MTTIIRQVEWLQASNSDSREGSNDVKNTQIEGGVGTDWTLPQFDLSADRAWDISKAGVSRSKSGGMAGKRYFGMARKPAGDVGCG